MLNDIVNSAYNLGEIYYQPKIFRKILRSLTENFRPKVTVITERKVVDCIPIDKRNWNSIEYGWEKLTTLVSEWSTS